MPKNVLIVEQSLAVRGIAESLLRQYGFEVFSAATPADARGILAASRIDLLLIDSDITLELGQPFYETLGADTATAMIPLLLLHDGAAHGPIDFPAEAVIAKPFTPREFMERVTVFGGGQPNGPAALTVPVKPHNMEDDIIDAALGLDKIEVSEAEVIGNDTAAFRVMNRKVTTEAMIGYEYKASTEDSAITKKKIDEISVPADPARAPAPPTATAPPSEEPKAAEFLGADTSKLKNRPAEGMSASSRIEIVPDQYGMISPADLAEQIQQTGDKPSSHDYDWFVKEMRNLGGPKDAKRPADSGSLKITPTADALHPAVPPPSSSAPAPEAAKPPTHAEAVDKFISEFRREVEKISGESPAPAQAAVTPAPAAPQARTEVNAGVAAALEKISPSEIRMLAQELTGAVAEKIAQRLTAHLDPQMVYQILRECFSESLSTLLKSRSGQQ
jgi:DNA-binding response OmpR family regulator